MVVKWFAKAQEHWDEQLEYCAETFGARTALDSVKIAEEKIERIVLLRMEVARRKTYGYGI